MLLKNKRIRVASKKPIPLPVFAYYVLQLVCTIQVLLCRKRNNTEQFSLKYDSNYGGKNCFMFSRRQLVNKLKGEQPSKFLKIEFC